MSAPTSLIDMLLNLLRDPQALAAFQHDPEGFLETCGLGDLSPADVHDALVLNQDSHEASFDRDYHTGGNHVQLPPPPPAPHPVAGESEHEAAIRYLNTYVTNNSVTNNYVDDRDTTVDNSVNQNIDNRGGHFDQDIDVHSNVASGDGAVAAGGNITGSTVTTGDGNAIGSGNAVGNGNVVGDDNDVVHGDGNTTAFGNGDATSTQVGGDVTLGDGAAFASGGNATVDNSDNSLHNVGNNYSDNSDHSITDSGNDFSDHSVNDSGNDFSDHSTTDSHDDNSTTVDHSGNSSVDSSTHDSGNIEVHI